MTAFAGKSVLVTGGGGSIGSQVCERVIAEGGRRLTMLSLTESGLYSTEKHLRKMAGRTEIVPVLGSVLDSCVVERAVTEVDIVVHAAAHKHVPMCEQNPVEAIKNNVFGTETLAWAALSAGVRQFCLISSDKAVQPASVMGATKRLAELIVARAGRQHTQENGRSRFFSVRFGNVLDSAGSVLPLWREQIRSGGPITLTDERCERYFMSIPDAVGLIAEVIALRPEGGTFVLDMGKPRRLVDMARELMAEMGQTVEIKLMGLRQGEKMTEELHHGGELYPTKVPRVSRVSDPALSVDVDLLQALDLACDECDREGALKLLWEAVC